MDNIRIGAFEIFPSERMLCAAGKPVELGARAFDLLLVLVEQHGRLVHKNTLLERVWPRLVVDENNLPAQIASLRRVLGAGAIRTVPGFGYRLELEVSAAPGPDTSAPTAVREHSVPRLAVSRRTWPNRLGPLVGRDSDVRDVQEALTRSSLVTIVGIAGVGKTRLAQEILARESAVPQAAVAWVALGPLEKIELVYSAIAVALGLSLPEGQDALAALRQALEDVPLLLILDCAEHLGDTLATPLAELISQTQALRVLVTSQAPLGVAGELVYRLSVLPVPEAGIPAAQAAQYAGVMLFAQRAAAADQKFQLTEANAPLVSTICRRLDGIPLALELAAARVPALGLANLLERLDDRFRLLRGPGRQSDPRHGALHAAFDWSYGLLTAAEQRVFNRLGTFAGSFSLNAAARCVADSDIDAAEAIDLVGRLVDRSLVAALAVDPPRYILLETARAYALDKLAAGGDLQTAGERMAATVLELLDVAYAEYWSLDEAIWLHRYEPELANVRAAMDWAIRHESELGVSLYGSAWPLFVETDLHAEGRARYSRVLALLSDGVPRNRIGRFWEAISVYDSTRQRDRAHYAAELAAEMYAATNEPRSHYFALMQLAANWRVAADTARTAFAGAKQLEDPGWPARLLAHGALTEGAMLMEAGRFVEARAAYQRAVRLSLTTSERQALAASVSIVELDIACGDVAGALQLGRPMLLSLRHLGSRETQFELLALIFSALLICGAIDEARATGAEIHELASRLDTRELYKVLDAMTLLACVDQRYGAALRVAGCSDEAHEARAQSRRRPVEKRMRADALKALAEHLGPQWDAAGAQSPGAVDELAACSLALGLSA
ncbi:MAG: winged helix-turn-helix domain-containing protein [Steroidobacteraceae bacterium]